MYQARNRIFLHIVRRHRKVRLQGIALPLYLYPVESRIQYLMGQDMFHPPANQPKHSAGPLLQTADEKHPSSATLQNP